MSSLKIDSQKLATFALRNPYPKMDLGTMQAIVAIGRELNMGRAADRIGLAQSYLSRLLKKTEDALDVSLFLRDRRGIREITEPGNIFIENLIHSIDYQQRATDLARAASSGKYGRLFLGVSPTIDLDLYFRTQKAFQQAHPDVALEFVSAFSPDQAYRIMRSDLHAGLIKTPIRCRGLSVLGIYREPVLFVMRKDDYLAGTKNITPRHLEGRKLILLAREAEMAKPLILRKLADWGCRPALVIDVLSVSQAQDFVVRGMGVAVLRGMPARLETDKLVTRSFPTKFELDIGVGYRRESRTPMLRHFLRVVRQEFARERDQMGSKH